MGIINFIPFLLTALLFVLSPGIDTVFVINKSISQGRKAGIYAALGINSGVLMHTLFAAMGLSIILAKSAMAFMIIKYIGAAYLIYLGISKLLSKKKDVSVEVESENKGKNNFITGFFTNLFNPKVALFFLAFFPQFISPDKIGTPTPFLVLGLSYAVLGVSWLLLLSVFAGLFAQKIKENPSNNKMINRFSGAIMILMGVKVALSKN